MARDFEASTATREEILARAATLPGRTLGELAERDAEVRAALRAEDSKSAVGYAIEAYFRIPRNPTPAPDFEEAGIELKTVPIVQGAKGPRVKERTVISLINYEKIVREEWVGSQARKKLHCLFVFVRLLPGMHRSTFPVLDVRLWFPSAEDEQWLSLDWRTVRDKVRAGMAHQLSESDGRVMGPSTKASDSSARRAQPYSSVPAKPRAFALKPSFVRTIFSHGAGGGAYSPGVRAATFEATVLARLAPFVGKTVDDVARAVGPLGSSGKSFGAAVLRRALGSPTGRSLPHEFTMTGLTPRSPRVSPDLTPYEAVSFPAFDHGALLGEVWEDSDLLSRIEYMLFLPRVGERRATPAGDCVVGRPVIWRPRRETLDTIRAEWEQARTAIRSGQVSSPLGESDTRAIHVRPHGRDGGDRVPTPSGDVVTRKSFWLNRAFVREILTGSS